MGSIFSTFSKKHKYCKIDKKFDAAPNTNILINNNNVSSFSAAIGSGISYCHEKVLKQLNLEAAPTKAKYCHGFKCIGEIKLLMKLENANFLHTFAVVTNSKLDFFVGDDFLKNFESISFLSTDKEMVLANLQNRSVIS